MLVLFQSAVKAQSVHSATRLHCDVISTVLTGTESAITAGAEKVLYEQTGFFLTVE